MIEVFTNGFFVGRPHEIGAGGAILLSDREEIGRVKRAFSGDEIGSSIAAELAVLTDALVQAKEAGHEGEEVVIRTGYASLADLCRGGGARSGADVQEWVSRLAEVARQFAEVRAIVSPGWVTARPHDLALRAILDRFREANNEKKGG